MFSYYGSKSNVIKFYPPPKHKKIIEPFAGSARYALQYWDHDVLLVDKYEVIIRLWKWLQLCSPGDILKLPRLKFGDKLDKINFDCEEERLLMGFLCGFSAASPRNQVTVKMKQRPNYINFSLERIAGDLHKIKHWDIQHGSYDQIRNQNATWFIDPPYSANGGHDYVESSKSINFDFLREWCLKRKGQIIVCEGEGATWMDFQPIKSQRTRNGLTHEFMYTNEPTSTVNKQLQIF